MLSLLSLSDLVKSQRPALRKLVKAAFDVDIQQGEHNSVIDARATMALYRMYRKQWENPKRAQGSPAPPADALIEGKIVHFFFATSPLRSPKCQLIFHRVAIASPPAPPLGTEPPLDESPFSSHTSSPTVVAPHKKRKSKDESNESGRGSPGLLPKAANKKVPPTLGNVEFQRNLSTMPNQRHGSEKFVNSDMNEDTSPSTVAPQKIQTQASKIKPKKVKGISSGISVVVKRNANRESNRASGGVDKRALDLSHKQGSRKTQTQGEWWKELN